jgi:rfaE bifunctional protein nucleotidyltransferase chain/domain
MQKKILCKRSLSNKVLAWRLERKKIVTLNGCFDVIHGGHVEFIHEASRFGDILVLLINEDETISKSKGPGRPIIPLMQRLMLLSSFQTIDFLLPFSEPTPCEMLSILCPDVHVNGEEYGYDCIEQACIESSGGRIALVPRFENLSTSDIATRIGRS